MKLPYRLEVVAKPVLERFVGQELDSKAKLSDAKSWQKNLRETRRASTERETSATMDHMWSMPKCWHRSMNTTITRKF